MSFLCYRRSRFAPIIIFNRKEFEYPYLYHDTLKHWYSCMVRFEEVKLIDVWQRIKINTGSRLRINVAGCLYSEPFFMNKKVYYGKISGRKSYTIGLSSENFTISCRLSVIRRNLTCGQTTSFYKLLIWSSFRKLAIDSIAFGIANRPLVDIRYWTIAS